MKRTLDLTLIAGLCLATISAAPAAEAMTNKSIVVSSYSISQLFDSETSEALKLLAYNAQIFAVANATPNYVGASAYTYVWVDRRMLNSGVLKQVPEPWLKSGSLSLEDIQYTVLLELETRRIEFSFPAIAPTSA